MASHFQIQKPYILANLPRPLDPSTGRYVVGDVYGSKPGSRKRKRAELTVGIDGEAVNIYDVSSARLVTSYPIPPRCNISCPVTSIRHKIPGKQDISRYTYAATDDSDKVFEVALFKDHVDASGKTTSTIRSVKLGPGSPVVSLTPTPPSKKQTNVEISSPSEDIIVVREDGEISCRDSEDLRQKWQSSPAIIQQGLAGDLKTNFRIQFCCSLSTTEVMRGILKDSGEATDILSSLTQDQDTDHEALVLISRSGPLDNQSRHLHVVGLLPRQNDSFGLRQGAIQLHVAPFLSSPEGEEVNSSYRLDVGTGTLLQLREQTLMLYDLTASIPKVISTIDIEGVNSFFHLSRNSLLVSTNTEIGVYNPRFKSLQHSMKIDLDDQTQADSASGRVSTSCELVARFSRLDLAVAIVNFNLVAIQLEAPARRLKKRRAEGLLIDSIGCGLHSVKRSSNETSRQAPKNSVFSNYLPGSIRGDYWKTWQTDETRADSLLNSNDIYSLEVMLADKFGIPVTEPNVPNDNTQQDSSEGFPFWHWPKNRAAYPQVDRRWIKYSISRTFQWNDALPDDVTIPRLICQLPHSNILNFLVDAGHLTLSNLKVAFRGKLSEAEQEDAFLAEQLITRLADIDPSLELLVTYLSATNTSAVELLLIVRTIMRSLELVQDPRKPPPKLLANGPADEPADGDVEVESIGMEIDDLEDEIQKGFSYLNEDAGIRGHGLTTAFSRLGSCSSVSMIDALRSTFKPEEILSLIYLLRIELVKGAWTARYLENTDFEKDASLDAPPDSIIKLIADLLGRCVDSIGPGGWLLHDTILPDEESGDFVTSLKLEVSAALEGLEEAVYLRGIVGEAVKFFRSSWNAELERAAGKAKPISVHVREPGAEALPLGLKSYEGISAYKVVGGGEVVERSQRETGHLVSQKVGPYSLERIAI